MKYLKKVVSCTTLEDLRAVEKFRAARCCGRRLAVLTACSVLVLIAWSLLTNADRRVSFSHGGCFCQVNTETFNKFR